jgi:catechol 2,3-dioxygenase-like lactoylglutathione lyase family enzyme
MKLTHARIVTNNVPVLTQFYQAITQIAPVGSADYVEFRSSIGTLALCSQHTVDLYNSGAATPAANRSTIIEFQVDDVDRERARLQGTVAQFVLERTTQPWGNRSMLFRDPDGNLINFFAPMAHAASHSDGGI